MDRMLNVIGATNYKIGDGKTAFPDSSRGIQNEIKVFQKSWK